MLAGVDPVLRLGRQDRRPRDALLVLTGLTDVERTPIDRVDGRAIECYPSAELYRFGFARAELKNAKTDREVRRRLLAGIMARANG